MAMSADFPCKVGGNARCGKGHGRDLGEPQGSSRRVFALTRITLLVRGDGAFYNPSNIASEAVVPFTRHPGTQLPHGLVAHSAGECLNIEFHFCNFQEH
jgi:hypothetical protein